MPRRTDILESFISAIEGLVPQAERPARAPMRTPAPAGGTGPDLEAARRLAGPARASEEGEGAVRAALADPNAPVPESRGSMAARASTAGQSAIAQEFESLIRQAQANPEPRFRGELRPDIRSQPPTPPQPPTGLQNAPIATNQLQSVIQRFGRQVQPRPPSPATPPNRLPTPAQTMTRREALRADPAGRMQEAGLGRQALTPSQAGQPQTAGMRAPPAPMDWDRPSARGFFDTHMRAQLGMTPEQFNEHYFAGYVRNARVSPDNYTSAARSVNISGDVRTPRDMVSRNAQGREVRVPANTYLGRIERDIRPQDREVYNAYFALDPQYQGMGIARQVFRNQIDVYRRMGNIDRVVVNAGLDGGGHTWARFGFVPNQSNWQRLQREVSTRLRTLTNVSPDERAAAEMFLANNDPYSIRLLAQMPGIGRRLLAGTRWYGTLDIRNPRDMNYFDAYVDPNRSR